MFAGIVSATKMPPQTLSFQEDSSGRGRTPNVPTAHEASDKHMLVVCPGMRASRDNILGVGQVKFSNCCSAGGDGPASFCRQVWSTRAHTLCGRKILYIQ